MFKGIFWTAMKTPFKVSGKDSCNLQKGKCFPDIDQRTTSLSTQIVHSHERSIGLQWKVMHWPYFPILALFLCCACPFCPLNISGKFIKAICREGDLFISTLSQNNKNPCIHIKMQLFLQPKLFHKGDIMYNIFRGNSQPCLAILQELYRWRIPFFNLNSLTHNKREKQDPRTLSFKTTYYSK